MKIKSIITLLSALALLTSPVCAIDETSKAGIAVGAGAAAGATTSAVVGTIGVAIGGTAVAVRMIPVTIVGGVVGLAGYGIYRIFN